MNNITKNLVLLPFNILYKLNPKLELEILYFLKQKRKLNLNAPKTYNEKLQWIKLYDKNPLMPLCCDKYSVRNYVREKGCEEILNDLYWHGNNPDNIPYDKLPNKFVIKVTHGSTFNIICKDKGKLDKYETKKKLNKWLKAKFLPCYGEWFYGIVKPRIIIEQYLENSYDDTELTDYKIFCFNGVPQIIRVDSGRFTDNHCKDIYDIEWNLLSDFTMGYPSSHIPIKRPECLSQMLDYARKLSEDFLHARVDFYLVNNTIYFGEITFTNGAGFDSIKPHSFHDQLGNYLKLPID